MLPLGFAARSKAGEAASATSDLGSRQVAGSRMKRGRALAKTSALGGELRLDRRSSQSRVRVGAEGAVEAEAAPVQDLYYEPP